MFRDKFNDIIVISSIDWNTQRQVIHELSEHLSKDKNNRVLFIENTGVRSLSFKKDFNRILSRIKFWFGSTKGFTKKNDNITIYTPLFFPFFIYSKISLMVNSLIITNLVMYWLKFNNFKSPVVISFLSTPLAQSLIKNINPKYNIFYCIDNMSESSVAAYKLKQWENKFFKNSDLIMCTSKEILSNAKKLNKNSFYAPSGVDFTKFEKIRLDPSIKKPEDLPTKGKIIGFVGGLRNILNKDLIYRICDEIDDATLVLIGPTFDHFKLEKKQNLLILGAKKHDDIPSYIKYFDATIIPYLKNKFTDSIYPTKINEYLAMGKPVVSTNIKEVENFNLDHKDIIKISKNNDDFIENIKQIIGSTSDLNKNLFIETAKKNSWKNRFELISQGLEKHLEIKNQSKEDWSLYLKSFTNRIRNKFIKNVSIFTLILFTIFYSPMFSYLEKKLYTYNDIKNSNLEALVIFSGHGNSNYDNFDYRSRYIDASFYLKKYPDLDVFIYGRSKIVKDSEIIKSLLIQKDKIRKDKIFTIETKMRNTYENIRFVRQKLLENEIKNILFLTAPLHSKRVELILEKNFKDINYFLGKTTDSYYEKLIWGSSFRKIKAVSYEYLAIIYNFFRGWL